MSESTVDWSDGLAFKKGRDGSGRGEIFMSVDNATRKTQSRYQSDLNLSQLIELKTYRHAYLSSSAMPVEHGTDETIKPFAENSNRRPTTVIKSRWNLATGLGINLLIVAFGVLLEVIGTFIAAPYYDIFSSAVLSVGSIGVAMVLIVKEQQRIGWFQ